MKYQGDWIEVGKNINDFLLFSPTFLFTIILYSILSIIYIILYLDINSSSDIGLAFGCISVLIGLISIYYAVYISRKSTKQLNDIQIDYWNTRGIEYRKLKKYDDALQSYEKAIDIDPLSSKIWINKANALSEKGHFIDAIEAIERAIELEDPASDRYPRALNSKGEILFRQGKCNEAIETFEEAIKLNSQLIYPWVNKGAAFFNLGEYDKAIEAYDEAIKLDSKFVGAHYGKGRAHRSNKEYKNAIEALDKAIEGFDRTRLELLDRHDIELYASIWCEKGITLKNQKRIDDAIHAYSKAIDFNPQYIVAWYNLGNIFRDKGEYDRAIEAYDKATDINPRDIDVLLSNGEVLFKQEKYSKALETCNKIIDIVPPQAPAYFTALVNKGNALCGLKKFDEALEALERARKLEPFNPIVLDNMSLFLRALGRNDEAEAASAKAKRLTQLVQHFSDYIDLSDS